MAEKNNLPPRYRRQFLNSKNNPTAHIQTQKFSIMSFFWKNSCQARKNLMKTGEKTLNEVMILKSTKFKRQAEQIMKIAEENGVQGNFLFATTFDRYLFLIETLENLKEKIKDEGLTVEKEYVKGKKNSYSSPCVKNYNTTCDLANKTVQTLMRVIRDFNVEEDKGEVDPLIRMINGERSE